jgi:hypothetical protein
MAYEQKENSGSLFKNSKKATDKHPDRTGSALIDGREYWVSGWVKQDKNGNPWMSLAFKPKDAKTIPVAKADGKRVSPRNLSDDMDGDTIPF